MQEDKKLKKVAKEIGQEIVAGKDEIPLNQPFPDQLISNDDNKSSNEDGSDESSKNKSDKSDSEKKDAETVAAGAAGADAIETNEKTDKNDKNNDNDKADEDKDKSEPIIAKTKRAENKLVVLFVSIGIAVCIIGLLLLILVSLLPGLIVIGIGICTIFFGVLSPPGY
jgi:hypothetical protein